jgi:hypothetical protein
MTPMTLEILKQDVQSIYSHEDKTTKSYQNEYEVEGNKITIVFKRVWEGKAAVCGVDMYGSADIKMQKRNPLLEKEIKTIIETPTNLTMAGINPVVSQINFN